jgi:adenylate cyclase
MSATSDSTFTSPEQLIADLQRQLAECRADLDKAQRNLRETTTERDEALAREAATAEVLGVINSSRGDLAAVFHAILEKARRLCDAAHGDLWTYDGEAMTLAATHGEPEFAAWLLSRGPVPIRPGSVAEHLIRGADHVQFEDPVKEQHAVPEFLAQMKRANIRSTLIVPMRKEQEILGAFHIYRQEVRPFSGTQVALLENFAAQAVIAMENARLLTETREALEQQTATADVLRVINSSPGDLVPVFEVMLQKAMRLCGAAFGTLWTFDGQLFNAASTYGVPAAYAEFLSRGPQEPIPGSTLGQFVSGRDAVAITDILAGNVYRRDNPNARAVRDLAGVRTLAGVALRKDGALLGAITIYRQEVRPFSEKQIALLQNFAQQAVIAMENARLITETREALEQQTATAEVLGVINSAPGNLAPVFDALLEKAAGLCDAVYGVLCTYDGERFHPNAIRSDPQFAEWLRARSPFLPRAGSPFEKIVRGERFVRIADTEVDSIYHTSPGFRELVDFAGIRTHLVVGLRRDETLSGALAIYRKEGRPFSEKEIALLQNFAAQAVIAMENARLLDELRQRTDQVAELNRGLEARVAEQVEELGRVGRLKRFLAPQLAELIVSQGDEKILESHRREIVVVFCDLRGYTAFTETAEPEEVLDFLGEYHGALGPLVAQFEGTLDQFSGDGIMVFFNDPVPCPDPAERAVAMAVAMREAAGTLIADWSRHGCELGFGAGIAQGYATLGQIGFSERSGYNAIGTVCNLAARLCAEAKDGQILVSSRIAGAVEAVAKLEDLGSLELKGLRRPVAAFNVVQSTSAADARPNLTVVARGPEA